MDIQAKHTYKQPIDTVFSAFGNPEAITQRLEAMGARNINLVTCELSETGLVVHQEREVPTDVPGVLKKVLGEWNHVVQKETWVKKDDGCHCDILVKLEGVPVTIEGTLFLHPEGEGCVNEIDLKINCSIPLIGGKLAKFVGHNVIEGMQEEFEFITAHLTKV
jgi:uncharacterized protein YndB with AHSA1/START domain